MKFNKIFMHNVKILGIVLIFNSVLHGSEMEHQDSFPSTSLRIKFENVVEPNASLKLLFPKIEKNIILNYIKKCMSHLDEIQTIKAEEILSRLRSDGQSAILDESKTDYGFNFPPMFTILKPFLSQCRPGVNVMDIGAGKGNDSIMAAISGANVIAVDILSSQIEQIKTYSEEILKDFGPYRLRTFKRDFSKQNSVPDKYVGKIQIVNANKVMHFLDDQETKIFINNVSLMLEDNGLIFITVCTPEEEQKYQREGICYIKQTCPLNDKMEFENVLKDSTPLVNLRGTEQFVDLSERGFLYTKYYARHFYTKKTLRDYLGPQFDILDDIIVKSEFGEPFISVIARKLPAKVLRPLYFS